MKNEMKYYIKYTLWTVAIMFVSGGIIQTFFLEIGFSGRQIGTYTAFVSIAQMAAMLVSIFCADNVKRLKDTVAVLSVSPGLLCVTMLPFCFMENVNVETVYYIALFCCCMVSFFTGLHTVLMYRIPYFIIGAKSSHLICLLTSC